MNLLDTINTIGHYAKNTWDAVKRPLAYVSAAAIILTTFNANELRAEGDDAYANGIIVVENAETGNSVEDATIYLRPENMAMYVPDTVYTFVTNGNGLVEFDSVLVYTDSTTDIQNYIQDNTMVVPNFGSDINVFLPENAKGVLQYITINGQIAKQKEFSGDHVHMNLSDVAAGIGLYRVILEDGNAITGKYVKMNVPSKGASSRPSAKSNFKNVKLTYDAEYWMIWEKEGFITDSTLITLHDGENDPIFVNMQAIDSTITIDNQDLSGIITDMNDNYSPIEGASVEVYIPSLDSTITTTSASDGSFLIEGVPLDTEITFSAGNISGKGSVKDFPYTTPSEITDPADSVWSFFDVVLPDDPSPSTTWWHTIDQNIHGTGQDTIWYYQENNVPEVMKQNNRNYFATLQSTENNVFIYAESFTPLNNIGITIEYGTYNTNPYEDGIITPLGNTLSPVLYANTSMGTGDYVNFVHEIKRGLGFDGVGWYSVMRVDSPEYTQEDIDIAVDVSRHYWNAVYKDEKTYIPMEYLVADMYGKRPQKVKDVKARIDELKKIAEKKAKVNNVEMNNYNTNSTYGTVEFKKRQER